MTPKYGIVGCGNISRFHFNGLAAAGAEIVHIADLNPKAAEPWVKKTGARYSADYRDLIADPAVTVVSVLTGARYHKEICLAALAAGKDVVCEKTMAADAAEAREIRQAARTAAAKNGAIFLTAFMKRYFPAAEKARELVPRLGKIFSARVRALQNWGSDFHSMVDAKPYQWVLDGYGGAALKCAGSHMLDMTMHLLGRPGSVMASVDHIPGSDFDRRVQALLEYLAGPGVLFETSIHSLSRIGYERNGWDESIEIDGSMGRLRLSTVLWDHPENNGALLEHYDEGAAAWTEYRYPAVDPFAREMADFHDILSTRRSGGAGVDEGCAVDLLIDAIERSSKSGSRITLEF
jgi:predicted dehydrogenase